MNISSIIKAVKQYIQGLIDESMETEEKLQTLHPTENKRPNY